MLFAARGLACQRGGVPVVQGLDLAAGPGEVVILRGRNGSGKTTLLRTLAGLQPPLAGTIEGQEETAYSSHLDGVKASLTVSENLEFWGAIFGTWPSDDLYRLFLLLPLIDRPAGTLSAGQSRRLGLARMALTARKVWLMDEPTVSLDAASVGQLAAVIGAHCKGGGAAVIASHIDLALGSDVGVRVVEMADYSPHALPEGAFADAFAFGIYEDTP